MIVCFAIINYGSVPVRFNRGGDSASGRRDVGQIREREAGGDLKFIGSGRREVKNRGKIVVGGGRLGKNGTGRRDAGQK